MSLSSNQGPPGSGGDHYGSSEDSTSDYAETVDFSEFTSIDTAQMVHRYRNGRYVIDKPLISFRHPRVAKRKKKERKKKRKRKERSQVDKC
jgi:hypothetical protein